ncbi:CTP synthase [Lachnospiraceae bacterium NK3A20]|nr:CTP synthase [Lachnospiraceae bacterium NK3A20]
MVKYVFVTGGVVSGLGKGITAASLGRLLKARGYKVTMQKFDPYLNVDPGTMNPIQHGEVFVTDDGTETDLDLGHYERFIDENLDHNANVTSGKVYWSVLNKERHGDYGGGTVQVIPHITNEIKSRFYRPASPVGADTVAIIEVGGTVGDIESQAFYEAIRQFQQEIGPKNSCMIHVTLIPYLYGSRELKTKPTQQSVKELQQMGIRADVIVCRSEMEIPQYLKDKIALFCNVPTNHVLQNLNADSIYEVPLMMEQEKLAQAVCECLDLPCPEPDLSDWQQMVNNLKNSQQTVEIALVGKYTQLHDAYLSVVEALHHGGIANCVKVNIRWVDSEEVEREGCEALLSGIDGMIVPGGFGNRGTEGMIQAATYAMKNRIPYLGICLGMQMAVVAFAREVLDYHDANSTEFAPDTIHPVIDLLPEQKDVENLGGTMRLGAYPCVLEEDSIAYRLYGKKEISERHRHRWEFNNDYREVMQEHGMRLCGQSPDGRIVEMIELEDHPFFVGTQAHPEFKSRPNRCHPLFKGLVAAARAHEEGTAEE